MTRPPLPARDAYRLWAPRYAEETVVSALDDAAVQDVMATIGGRTLLDVGCGIGRRITADAAPFALGVDLVPEMLARAEAGPTGARPLLAAADVLALPIRAAAFDILWCRLVLGHVPDPGAAYRELGRVAATGATLIVTDFHPAARAAGHERTFRDADGRRHTVEHHDHGSAAHIAHARAAGWRLTARRDLAVGPAVRPFYERAGALDRYAEQVGLAMVLLLVLTR